MLPRLDGKTIPALNGIRALAVTLVVLEHFGFESVPGTHGVLMFFVLSGFLITWLLLREHETTGTVSLREFYWRRALRILPAFYVFLAVALTVLVVSRRTIHREHVAMAALYVANYFNATHAAVAGNGVLNHIWSLAIEEQFYLLWPFAFVALRGSPRRIVWAVGATIVCVWIYRSVLHFAGVPHRYLFCAFETRADHLLVGCFAAALVRAGMARRLLGSITRWAWAPVLTIAAWGASIAFETNHFGYRHVVGYALDPVLAAVAILQLVAHSGSIVWRWLDWTPVAWVGTVSYSVYLYQQLGVFGVARFVGPSWPTPLRLAGAVAVTIILASASHYLVERPFLRLKDSLKHRDGDLRLTG